MFILLTISQNQNLLTLSQKVGKSGKFWKNISNFVPNEKFHWNIRV